MQLRSQYGQSVYIIQTREIKQGGLFGSDLLAKKQYEIEYMVSEGDAPYGKKPHRLPDRPSSASRTAALTRASAELRDRAEPVKTAASSLETNLNDLDALIDSLKALKSRTESRPATSVAPELQPEERPVKQEPEPSLNVEVRPEEVARKQEEPVSHTEAMPRLEPTREELEALLREPEPVEAVAPQVPVPEEDRNPLARIRERLIENQASAAFVDRFLQRLERSLSEDDRLHPGRVRSRSLEKMKEMIRITPSIEREHGERKIVFFVGPHGSGKTTSLAKLAYRYRFGDGPDLSIYSLDLHRVAATEQLKTYAAVLQVPFFSPLFESDFREYLDRDGAQLIFVDTSGMGLRNADRRDELVRFIESVQDSVEVHLVMPVSLSPSLTEKYMEFFEPVGFEKILLTRLDEADFLANFIEVADKWKRPFSFLNNSPEVSSPLMNAGPEDLARMVLGLNS